MLICLWKLNFDRFVKFVLISIFFMLENWFLEEYVMGFFWGVFVISFCKVG